MFIDWLQKRVTVEEAEAENLVVHLELGPDPVPFGFIHDDWRRMVAAMRPGDELWTFNSPAEDWEIDVGREGFCVVRNRRMIDHIVTEMN